MASQCDSRQSALACEKLPPDTLIDGEVVVVDNDGRVKFNACSIAAQNGMFSSMPSIFSFTTRAKSAPVAD